MQRSFILSPLAQRLTLASAFALLLALTLILASPVQAQDDSPPPDSPPSITSAEIPQEAQEAEQEHGEERHEEPVPPIWLVLPFLTLLLMIATGPLFYAHH